MNRQAELLISSSGGFRDLEIPAYFPSQDGVDLGVAGYRGNLLPNRIYIHGVPAAFPQFLASVFLQVSDQFPSFHSAATETDSL